MVGGAGATIGSTAICAALRRPGKAALPRYTGRVRINGAGLARAEAWLARHGGKAVLLGRLVPVVREMISVPAGVLRMRVPKFLLYTFVGPCAWSTGVILAGYYFGVSVFGGGGGA